jgi:hypothetical protein
MKRLFFKYTPDDLFSISFNPDDEVLVSRVSKKNNYWNIDTVAIKQLNLKNKEWVIYETDYKIARGLSLSTFSELPNPNMAIKKILEKATIPMKIDKIIKKEDRIYYILKPKTMLGTKLNKQRIIWRTKYIL